MSSKNLHPFTIIPAAIILMLLTLPTIARHARTNLASRQAYTTLSVPANHPRQHIWSALRQTRAGNHAAAINTLQPHAAGDRLAAQLTARAHEQAGNYTAAAQIWQQFRDAESLQRVATAALQNDALEDAQFAFEAQWRVHPVLGTNRYANFLEQELNDPQAAEAVFRYSIETYPSSIRYNLWLTGLAQNLIRQEKWTEVIVVYEQQLSSAGRLYPADAENISRTYTDMAWALHMSGQRNQAIVAMERALQLQTEPHSLGEAGRLYEAMGARDKALEVYRRWLAIDPTAQTAVNAIKRLNQN